MSPKQVIKTSNAPDLVGPYNQAIKAGDFIYCSGQIAIDPNLIGAMCAITWHIYDNQDALYGLVTLQGIFTFIGNSTSFIA